MENRGSRVAQLAANWTRYWPFGSLYFVQGLQNGFLAAVVLRLILGKEAQISQTALIASALTWAWTAKAVFALVADKWASRRREILVGTTLASAMVLVIAAAVGFAPPWMVGVAVLLGVLRCLQDVTVDGVAIATLQGKERATGNTVMWLSHALGAWVGGAGMLTLKAQGVSNFTLTLTVAGLLLAVGFLGVWFGRAWRVSSYAQAAHIDDKESSKVSWREIAKALKETPLAVLVLAGMAYLGGQGFTSAFVGQWLTALEFNTDDFALLDTIGNWAGVIGVVLGGMLARKLTSRHSMAFAFLLAAVSYSALGFAWPFYGDHMVVVGLCGVTSFADGVLVVVLATAFMSAVGKRAAATQYALYAGFLNLSIVIGPLLGGAAMEYLSMYSDGLILSGLIGLLPLIPLWWLRLPRG